MNHDDSRELLIRAITEVAPDVDPESVRASDSLRVDLELDSMDFLSIVEKIAEQTGVEIPEEDYAELTTIDAFAEYLAGASSSAN